MAKNFKQEMKEAKNEINKAIEKTFQGGAIDIFSEIVRRTPVDTGRLRGNWQAEVEHAKLNELDVEDPNGGSTINAGIKDIKKFELKHRAIYLSNNLPYAKDVEDGSSKQRPEGMVKGVIASAKPIIEKFARINKV